MTNRRNSIERRKLDLIKKLIRQLGGNIKNYYYHYYYYYSWTTFPLSQNWIEWRYWSPALICHTNQSNEYYLTLIQGCVEITYRVGCIDKSCNILGIKQRNIRDQRNPSMKSQLSEAVAQTCSVKKIFFAKFTGKHLCQSLFLRKLQAAPAILFKKRLWRRCFPVNFAKFTTTPFFTEHLWWVLLNSGISRHSPELVTHWRQIGWICLSSL